MKKKSKEILLFLFYLLFSIAPLFVAGKTGDDFKKRFKEANDNFNLQNYSKALNIFLQLDSIDPENSNINFKIALCFFNSSGEKIKSIPYFEKAIKNISKKYNDTPTEEGAPPIALYYLAKAYHLNYNFDQSIDTFNHLKKYMDARDIDLYAEIKRYIAFCNNGKLYITMPLPVEIKNLGNKINTQYPEYAPVISADESTLIFTSRKPESANGRLTDEKEYYENIYISYKKNDEWTYPENISINTDPPTHQASVGLSADGQTLLLFKEDGSSGNIYQSNLMGNSWSPPVKLSDHVNSDAMEPSACISPDGSALYFCSDRNGGFGGRDIYKSKKLPNGDWGLPVNLGPQINTPYDEDGPFIHSDGKTLFFSSKGHTSMGGFDVFFSIMNDEGGFQKPFNLGYPVNTTDDDIYYVLSPDGKRAYYSSSSQEGGFGEKDIYQLNFIEYKETPLALVNGIVLDIYGNVPRVEITVTNNETKEIVGKYLPHSKTGKYLFILSPGVKYNISYESDGFLIKSESLEIPGHANYYEINKSIDLLPVVLGQKILIDDLSFDFNNSKQNTPLIELDKIYLLMKQNPMLKVEVSVHTDQLQKEEMNLKLSQEKARAIVDYIASKGVEKSRLIAKGYGSSKPVTKTDNTDGTSDSDINPNRRIEIQVISTGN